MTKRQPMTPPNLRNRPQNRLPWMTSRKHFLRTPAFKVRGALVARLHQDGCSLVVRMVLKKRAELWRPIPRPITSPITISTTVGAGSPVAGSSRCLRDLLGGARRLAAAEKRASRAAGAINKPEFQSWAPCIRARLEAMVPATHILRALACCCQGLKPITIIPFRTAEAVPDTRLFFS